VTACPACNAEVVHRQEYCVECGLRLIGRGLVEHRDHSGGWGRRTLFALVLASIGAATAIAANDNRGGGQELLTAIGGFATVPTTAVLPPPSRAQGTRITTWPARREGWTITLAWVPQTGGRRAAVDRAQAAADRGLAPVGILDSSRFASLHPGYWVVFTGIYASEAEAGSELAPAQSFASTAAVRRIVP
jgi:hypothetical protein